MGVLIAARASMGIGGALMMPSTLSIITDMFRDPAERQRAIGLWAGTTGVGFALGPIVGGLLLAHFWWGSVFLINVPIAAARPGLRHPAGPGLEEPGRAARPTSPGALLSDRRAGPGALVAHRGAGARLVLAPGDRRRRRRAGGPGGLRRVGAGQLAPDAEPAVLPHRRFSAAVSSVGLVMFGLFGALFVLTQFLQFGLGYSALQAGVRVLPAARRPSR